MKSISVLAHIIMYNMTIKSQSEIKQFKEKKMGWLDYPIKS